MILEMAALFVMGGALVNSVNKFYVTRKSDPPQAAFTSKDTSEPQQEDASESKIKHVHHGVIETTTDNDARVKNNRTLALSSASLGLATVGVVIKPLSLVTIPIVCYVFYPSFKASYQALFKEGKLNVGVMDATRIMVCISMGYYFVAALDAWLRTITERVLVNSDEQLNDALEQQFNDQRMKMVRLYANGLEQQVPLREITEGSIITVKAGDLIPVEGSVLHGTAWVEEVKITHDAEPVQKGRGDDLFAGTLVVAGELYIQVTALKEQIMALEIREILEQTIEKGSNVQKLGEVSGNKMRPAMLATFALAWPFWRDANRAAGFLTTSFGAQMKPLGPHTLTNFVNLASQQGILIKDGRSFEFAKLINIVMIDASLFAQPSIRAQLKSTIEELRAYRWPMQALSKHPFTVYLLADNDRLDMKELISEFGFDDGFVEPVLDNRVKLIEQLQQQGRFVCYIGDGTQQAAVMEKSMMSISIGGAATIKQDVAQVVLTDKHLGQLPKFFELAEQFNAKQRFNLAWPFLMDVVDIFTTVFVHFGLTYSVLFAHTGTLVSALNAKRPLEAYKREETTEHKGLVPSYARLTD